MSVREWLRPPRSWLVLFLGTTLVLLTGLGWLGLRTLEQERTMEVQRIREQLESSADLIGAEVRQNLAEVSEQLTRLSALSAASVAGAASSFAAGLGEDAVVVVFGPGGVEAYPAERLLYYPVLPLPEPLPTEVFATGNLYEYQRLDFERASVFFDQISESANPAIRAEALMRLATNQRKAGRPEAALATFSELAEMGDVPAGGGPAILVALRTRCNLLKEAGRPDEVQAEAHVFEAELRSGRWRLTRAAYENFSNQLRACRSRVDRPEGDDPDWNGSMALSLAEGVHDLWERWSQDPHAQELLGGEESLLVEGRRVFLLWSGTGDRLVALAAGGDFLQDRIIGPSEALLERQGVRIELLDREGQAVASSIHAAADEGSQQPFILRTTADTNLPWTLRVINFDPAAGDPSQLTDRRRLLFAGLGVVAMLVVAGSYFSARAITRESEAARLQSEFVAAVSHEFRTPLTSMRQFTDMLVDGRAGSEEERAKYYAALSRGTRRLTRLVESLLDFGRMEAGSHGFNLEPIRARDWVEAVTSEFQEEVGRLGYRVELAWNAEDGIVVLADEAALGRALWNLLDNAVKYSPDSKTIWVEGRTDGRFLTLSVRDRGIGISERDQQEVFRKFVRGTSPKGQAVKGTGLGLALVDQIVRAHDGTIQLESRVGEGSTFSIRLPEQV